MADENLAVELAQLREQMKAIAENVETIKTSVAQIMQLDRTIAEMGVRNDHIDKEVATMWSRIDSHKAWEQSHDHESLEVRQRIADSITKVDAKVEAVVNKGRGALWALGISFSVVQAVVAASIIWAFSHVSEADSVNTVQQYRNEQLEAANKILEKK